MDGSNRIFIKKMKNNKKVTDNVSKMINEELSVGMDKLKHIKNLHKMLSIQKMKQKKY